MSKDASHMGCDKRSSLVPFLAGRRFPFPKCSQALLRILEAMAAAGKQVNEIVRRLDLAGVLGTQGTHNPSGDEQQKMDIIANHHFVQALASTGEVAAIISEELTSAMVLPDSSGNYMVALDPLDGSANIDVNAPVGTLFSVYRIGPQQKTSLQETAVLQSGKEQLAAGYILYSTSTMLVCTVRDGVHAFTYEPAEDKFLLAYAALRMPPDGHVYAFNDGYLDAVPGYVQTYIRQCRSSGYAARYMGSLVADFHRQLLQGGIYLYPPTPKHPKGKLRLMLECNALALIAEQAGGVASDGQQPILSVQPQTIHQRVPLYIGSRNMVQNLMAQIG